MVKVFLAQEGGRGKEIGVTRINLQPSFIGIQSNSVADSSVGRVGKLETEELPGVSKLALK